MAATIFVLTAAVATYSATFAASSPCVYDGMAEARRRASEMKLPNAFEDRILVALDVLINQMTARRLLECAFEESKAQETVETLTGPITFGETVYQMRLNDYAYGVVGFSAKENNFYAAKMTAQVAPAGNVRINALFVMEQTPNERKWLRHENGSFRRDDSYCLSCHMNRAAQNYLFDIAEYYVVP